MYVHSDRYRQYFGPIGITKPYVVMKICTMYIGILYILFDKYVQMYIKISERQIP